MSPPSSAASSLGAPSLRPTDGFVRRVGRSKRATVGIAVLGTLALCGLFADLVASDGPIVRSSSAGLELWPTGEANDTTFEVRPAIQLGPTEVAGPALMYPSSDHFLGTDLAGRDVFARLVHGARIAFTTAFVVALLGVLGGAIAGATASLYSRRMGQTLERAAQAVDAFPALIVVALVRAIEGRSSTMSIVVGATIVQWSIVARLVRTEVQRLNAEDFVLAARALGASGLRIVLRHLLPHFGPSLVSAAALGVSAVVTLEATLSFLGLGPAVEGASWGEMLAEGAQHPEHAPLFFLPALMLSLTIGSAYLVAEGVREAVDPVAVRLRNLTD